MGCYDYVLIFSVFQGFQYDVVVVLDCVLDVVRYIYGGIEFVVGQVFSDGDRYGIDGCGGCDCVF